jgi:hypothetical protein
MARRSGIVVQICASCQGGRAVQGWLGRKSATQSPLATGGESNWREQGERCMIDSSNSAEAKTGKTLV